MAIGQEAVATAAYVRNRMPTAAFRGSITPYQQWYGRKPNISHLKVFGCMAYALIPDVQRKKLDKKAEKFRFIGYCNESKGYRLIDEKTKKVYKRRDVIFSESDFKIEKSLKNASEVEINPDEAEEHQHPREDQEEEHQELEDHQEEEQHYPRRQRRPPVRFGKDEYVATVEESVNHVAYKACEIIEPKTLEEALASDHAEEWKTAIDSEYESLIENETWELVELPSERKAIGCKWVFKVKHAGNGEVERFKARLVAKGYAQKYGVDFEETFSPVSSIRALIAFAIQHDMLIHQMDVVTAFLNGTLDEEIYMQQPDGYSQPGKEHLVCRLKRSLYGLKQSPRCWNTAFTDYLESISLVQSEADPCVFVSTVDTVTVGAVYVDDLVLIAKTTNELQKVKDSLSSHFKMKDMEKSTIVSE